MDCKYNRGEICTNDQCPMRGDYCPVPDYEGVCKYEDRDEQYVLTPKGCLEAAFIAASVMISHDTFDAIWDDFSGLMKQYGYVQE